MTDPKTTIAKLRCEIEAWEETAAELVKHQEALCARLAAVYSRTPAIVSEMQQKRANTERLLVLAGVASNPIWQTVLSYADEHARNELQLALRHDLSDGQRQFEAGRAASAQDFAAALRDLALEAERVADKQRG